MKENQVSKKIYQQGDVVLRKCHKLPTGVKKVKTKTLEFVLAEGEKALA